MRFQGGKMAKYRDKEKEFNLSNDLINSKYNMSPLAKDIMNIAITRIEETNDPDAPLSATLYNFDIYNIIGKSKEHNIARELTKVSKELMQCNIIINDGKGGFDGYVIAPNCHYHGGIFSIDFNKEMRNHLLNIKGSYTTVNLISSAMCDKFYTKRIYEILKEEYYKLNPKNMDEYVSKEINLSEFRFLIGTADQNEEKVAQYIKKCKREKKLVDWDYAYEELAIKKEHKKWSDFCARVLKIAQKDIAQVTEIKFDFEKVPGAHNKVLGIKFKIYPNTPNDDIMLLRKQKMDAVEKGESEYFKQQDITDYVYGALIEFFEDHQDKFGKEEIELFLQDAKGDEELVRWAVASTDRYAENAIVNNYIGAIRDRIKNPDSYRDNVAVAHGVVLEAEKVQEFQDIVDVVHSDKEMMAKKSWEKAKNNQDFAAFLDYAGFDTVEKFEAIYEQYDERFDEYTNWKLNIKNKEPVDVIPKDEPNIIGRINIKK